MKTRTLFYSLFVLVVLLIGAAALAFSARSQEPRQAYPAAINRSCAPWDGTAFSVSIPVGDLAIDVSIWQAPDIKRPVTFSFPDNTGQIGNASYFRGTDFPEELTGEVSFQRVEEGKPVEGRFDLTSARGERFSGTFTAKWGDQIMLCG